MNNIKCILLISTCCFLPNPSNAEINLTFDTANISSSSPTLHTHHTPVELKPMLISNSGVKFAAVCSIMDDRCLGKDAGFSSGDKDYNLDTGKLCNDAGYNLSSCQDNQIPQDFCPQNENYFRNCTCGDEFKYTATDCSSQFPNSILGPEQCISGGVTYSNTCVCNTATYPYTTANCPTPQILSGSSCLDASEQYYNQCSCPISYNCDLGCKDYHSAPCDSSCKECKSCSPAPVPEGYSVYDKSCGNDEIKKTFDDGCETTYYKCEKACVPEVGHIYYSDGTCSASNDATKKPIGLVYWVLDNGRKNTFNVMALDEPPLQGTWNNTINYCRTYSKYGVTGWKLPEFGELIPMSVENPYGVSNNKYNILNAKLASISGATQMKNDSYYSSSYISASKVWYNRPSIGFFAKSGDIDFMSNYRLRCVLTF